MNDERFDNLLDAMKNESVPPADLAAAQARVFEKLKVASSAACNEWHAEFSAYLAGTLTESRRLLLDDHLSRCPDCRRALAEMRGDRKVIPMPVARPSLWNQYSRWAIAAGVVLVALYVARGRIDTLLAPGGPRATVASVSGDLYKVSGGALTPGTAIGEGDVIRTGSGSRAVLRLSDGSAVEINERSELALNAAWSGLTVKLDRGDVIVQAAKQRRGGLHVRTRDSVATVKGTIFAVSAGLGGSSVSVVEGAVAVTQAGSERVLHRGEFATSNPQLAGFTARESVAWSQDAEKYFTLLGEFSKLEKSLAAIPSPALRHEPRLLQYMPAGVRFYAALPNIGNTLNQAVALADDRARESEVFRQYWDSGSGRELKQVVTAIRTITPLLGDEIVFAFTEATGARNREIPLMIAEVNAGQQDTLKDAIEGLFPSKTDRPAYQITDKLLLISDSPESLGTMQARLGTGASSPFAKAIAERYQRGAGWLLAVDPTSLTRTGADSREGELLGAKQLRYIFFEQRSAPGGEENDATFSFAGKRSGIASWLAAPSAAGSSEYVSSDAVVVFSASIADPLAVYNDFVARATVTDPKFPDHLREFETKTGVNIANDIASAIGRDFTVAVETPTMPIPGWFVAAEVYRPDSLDATVQRLADFVNSELKPEQQNFKLTLSKETVDGRTWMSVKSAAKPETIQWTYDRGYVLLGMDRAVLARAIATRSGGFPLVRSPQFRHQLPSSAGIHQSGFFWLNIGGALKNLPESIKTSAFKSLLDEREPVLITLDGEAERIRAASRTRLTSLVFDLMMAGPALNPAKASGAQREVLGAPARPAKSVQQKLNNVVRN